jgi:prepilin-type N-terminal cleavage/methylation domain-containing protein
MMVPGFSKCHGVVHQIKEIAMNPQKRDDAFTLLEILIVVAIIAILAAIAVVSFQEAQTRARVTRAKADLRSFATALGAYYSDNGKYPYPATLAYKGKEQIRCVYELTTPVAYMTSVDVEDVWKPDWSNLDDDPDPKKWRFSYQYFNLSSQGYWGKQIGEVEAENKPFEGYVLSSVGPDRMPNQVHWLPVYDARGLGYVYINSIYDPTNGTVSRGDIVRWAGRPSVYGAF